MHGKRDPGSERAAAAAGGGRPAAGGGRPAPKDYKALYEEAVKESRKWEKRSKDNLAQLNDLKGSQGKPDPTIEECIAAFEKENGDYSHVLRAHNCKLNSADHAAYYC